MVPSAPARTGMPIGKEHGTAWEEGAMSLDESNPEKKLRLKHVV